MSPPCWEPQGTENSLQAEGLLGSVHNPGTLLSLQVCLSCPLPDHAAGLVTVYCLNDGSRGMRARITEGSGVLATCLFGESQVCLI